MTFGGYSPYYPFPTPNDLTQYKTQYPPSPLQTPPPNPGGGLIWVQGEAGAKSYIVAPGNTVALWDSENPMIYLKTVDASGMPSMRVLEWAERTAAVKPVMRSSQNEGIAYVRRDEFEQLAGRLEDLAGRIETLGSKPASKNGKSKEDMENE